jgi:hypothetical protein
MGFVPTGSPDVVRFVDLSFPAASRRRDRIVGLQGFGSTCIGTLVVQRQRYHINGFLVDRNHLTW